MNGKPMLSFLTLGELMLKRSDPLRRWIEQWYSELGRSVDTLDTEGWFIRGHDHDGGEENIYGVWITKCIPGTFIWITPPRVTRIVIE